MTLIARERLQRFAIRHGRGVEFHKGTLKFKDGEVTLSELSKEDIERKEKAFSDMKSNGIVVLRWRTPPGGARCCEARGGGRGLGGSARLRRGRLQLVLRVRRGCGDAVPFLRGHRAGWATARAYWVD